mmetsp:Transcript_12853/g.18631  ORF Transcript_12853/g.18631 Transcript_12853/m.18631 type:complete len:142 (+) Transcript_12853:57-482(+)
MERGTEQRAVQVQTRSERDSLLENYHALLQTHTKLLDKRDVLRDSHDGHAPAMSQSSQMLHLLQLELSRTRAEQDTLNARVCEYEAELDEARAATRGARLDFDAKSLECGELTNTMHSLRQDCNRQVAFARLCAAVCRSVI